MQTLYINAALLDPRQNQFDAVWGSYGMREPKNNHDHCYFCMIDMSGWNQRKMKDWLYPDIESVRRPIPHCAKVPVFVSLPDLTADEMLLEAMDDTDSTDSSISSSSSMAAAASSLSAKPKPFSQGQLNGLVCDLGLSEKPSEILAYRLDEHGILDSGTKITFHRDRDNLLIRFSLWKMTLCIATTSNIQNNNKHPFRNGSSRVQPR